MSVKESETELVDLLGDTRAGMVVALRRQWRTVAELAAEIGLSEVAIRRHLQVLERDGLVTAETVRRDRPGRPSARYTLTDRGHRLFGDRNAQLANELLTFLKDEQAVEDFLQWRLDRQGARYAEVLADSDAPPVERLAQALSEDGYSAEATEATDTAGRTVLTLKQGHCAIADVAREHPELCAYETAMFAQLLGTTTTRTQTIAGGAGECICHIEQPGADPNDER